MTYAASPPPFDPARAERSKAEIVRAEPLTLGDPAQLHLTEHRSTPADIGLGCADLRMLRPPIAGRPATDFACVSLLRPAPDVDPTAAELAFIDAAGHPSATEPRRVQWRFVENGCRNGWFWAGGSGDRAVLSEGFLAKPLATVACGAPGVHLGWGARAWLPYKALPKTIKSVLIAADRRPAEGELDAAGKPLCEGHDRAYRHLADHLILELGDGNVLITPDPGALGKDGDEILRVYGATKLLKLLESAAPAQLSENGWVEKLASMARVEYDRNRKGMAKQLGVRLATLDGMRRTGQQDTADKDVDETARSRLIAIAVEHDLFQDDGGDAFCAVGQADGGIRTFKVEGEAFVDWLLAEYGTRYPTKVGERQIPGAVNASARADALRSIVALARQGEARAVFLRLGWSGDRLYLDLGTPEPRAVEITPDG